MQFNPATGIKDDLFTHAVAVESEGKTVILISIDTSGLGTAFSDRVRCAIHEKIDVEPSAIMVSAIHIHTGAPQLLDVFWGQGEDEKVNDLFFEKTVEAAIEAYNKRVPVTVDFGEGREDRISFCRNYLMDDGNIKTNPGWKGASHVVRPASEIDYTVSAMRFNDASGKTVAEIVNFACHPDTVGGTEYSADYPGVLRRRLKKKYGDHTVVFINGCSGNVNHVDIRLYVDPDFRYDKSKHYKYMGDLLAEDVVDIYENSARSMDDIKVDFRSCRFIAERRQVSKKDLEWADKMLADEKAWKVNQRIARELYKLKDDPILTETVEIQVLRIGDVCVVGFPGEAFADMGMRLRERVAPRDLIISELANNELGYFATEPAYSAGVYEAVLPSSVFDIPVLEKMIDTAEKLVKDVTDDLS